MSKARGSPRKFAEKIALLNKKEAESNAEFEKIIKEVEQSTRGSPNLYSPLQEPLHGQSYQGSPSGPPPPQWASPELVHQHQHQQQQVQQQDSHMQYGDGLMEEQQLPLLDSFIAHSPTTNYGYEQSSPSSSQHHHQHHQQHEALNQPAEPQMVPNIKIFPIGDDVVDQSTDYQQQQQQQVSPHQSPHQHHHQHHHPQTNSSNYPLISSARSLPDITNLRVSSGSFSSIGSAHSDQRLSTVATETTNGANNDNNYNHQSPIYQDLATYDANSNIVKDQQQHQQQQAYCSPVLVTQHPHDTTTVTTELWQQQPQQGYHFHPDVQHQTDANSFATSVHHHHHQQQSQMIPIVRASSTNAVSNFDWSPTQDSAIESGGDTLAAPRISNSLSRSSDGCYGSYMDQHHQHQQLTGSYETTTSNNQQQQQVINHHQQQPVNVHSHRFRSSSYNSLGQMQGDTRYAHLASSASIAKSPQFYG